VIPNKHLAVIGELVLPLDRLSADTAKNTASLSLSLSTIPSVMQVEAFSTTASRRVGEWVGEVGEEGGVPIQMTKTKQKDRSSLLIEAKNVY
jgi:hypothetical protein